MNIFAGVGKIIDVSLNGKVLKFNLAILQEKPCYVPCVLFDPNDEVMKFIEQLQAKEKVVSLQGRVSSYEFESNGRTIRKIDIVTFPKSIRPI